MSKPKQKAKTHRIAIGLDIKEDIIRCRDNGLSNGEICKKFNLTSSTVATIYSSKGRATLKKAKEEQISLKTTKFNALLKPPVMQDMESILYKYIQINLERKIYLLQPIVCAKA